LKKFLGIFGFVAVILGTSAASAIDLRNEDQIEYTVKVQSTAMLKDVFLPAYSMSIVICVGECQFYVPGVGKVSAKGSDVVTIKHGRLVKSDAPRVAQAK